MGRDNMNASYLLIIDDLSILSEVKSWSYDSPTLKMMIKADEQDLSFQLIFTVYCRIRRRPLRTNWMVKRE